MHASSIESAFSTPGSAIAPWLMSPEYNNDKPSSLCRNRAVRASKRKCTGKIRLPKSDIEFWKFRPFSENVLPNLANFRISELPNFGTWSTSEFRKLTIIHGTEAFSRLWSSWDSDWTGTSTIWTSKSDQTIEYLDKKQSYFIKWITIIKIKNTTNIKAKVKSPIWTSPNGPKKQTVNKPSARLAQAQRSLASLGRLRTIT